MKKICKDVFLETLFEIYIQVLCGSKTLEYHFLFWKSSPNLLIRKMMQFKFKSSVISPTNYFCHQAEVKKKCYSFVLLSVSQLFSYYKDMCLWPIISKAPSEQVLSTWCLNHLRQGEIFDERICEQINKWVNEVPPSHLYYLFFPKDVWMLFTSYILPETVLMNNCISNIKHCFTKLITKETLILF